MRVGIDHAHGIGNTHRIQQIERAALELAAAQFLMLRQRLADLRAHGQHRIQAGHRLLKNHGDARTAQGAHGDFRQGKQILAVEFDAATDNACRRGQQAHQGQGRHRLAATGFTQERERLAAFNAKTHRIHGARLALAVFKPDAQILHFKQGAHSDLGSKASRTASANKLAANTNANMKTKAAAKGHHTMGSRANSKRALLIILPQLCMVGSTPTPT